MPYLIVVAVGGALGFWLVQSGRVTSARLVAGFYAVTGGLLGLLILRAVAGTLGPVAAIVAATVGAIVLLYLAKNTTPGGD